MATIFTLAPQINPERNPTNDVTTNTSAIRKIVCLPQHNNTRNKTKYTGPATVISMDSVISEDLYTPARTVVTSVMPKQKKRITHK